MPKDHLMSFANAKTKSIGIFKNLYSTSRSMLSLYSKFDETLNHSNTVLLVTEDSKIYINESAEKCLRIISLLERNHMKCAFFGRTSNGKSTVINAILGQKILPCGLGHTTNCFVQVQGTMQDQGFIVNNEIGDGEPRKSLPIQSLSELSHAFSSEKLSSDSIVYLNWPERECALLKSDVTILDSPGVDIDPDLDFWIDKHCMDADVFVLVSNSESTLSKTEKQFFLKVRDKISNPFIFILNNRWDLSEVNENNDTNFKETKEQHKTRCIDFLVKELGVCSPENAEKFVYFVSGKEVMEMRMKEFTQEPAKMNENQRERYQDFETFENNLEMNLCTQALKTKFFSHTKEGSTIVDNLHNILQKLYTDQSSLKSTLSKEIEVHQTRIKTIKSNNTALKDEIGKKINSTINSITSNLTSNFMDQVNNLSKIIREFPSAHQFDTDSTKLLIYKTDLSSYLEKHLNSKLTHNNSSVILRELKAYRKFLIKKYGILLDQDLTNHPVAMDIDFMVREDSDGATTSPSVSPDHPRPKTASSANFVLPFESIQIPCNTLLSKFKENLEFQWPLNPNRLICCLYNVNQGSLPSRIYGGGFSSSIMRYFVGDNNVIQQTPDNSTSVPEVNNMMPSSIVRYQNLLRNTFGAMGVGTVASEIIDFVVNPQFIGLVGITIIIRKGLGLGRITSCGIAYGLLYAFEKRRWSTSSQEKIFRRQFVKYATVQLTNFAHSSSKNQCVMIKQEMLMMDKSFQRLTETTVETLIENMTNDTHQMKSLTESEHAIGKLSSSTKAIKEDISSFTKAYLQ